MDFYEKTISSKTIFKGKVFEVLTQEVLLNDNSKAGREIIIHNGGAAVLAMDSSDFVILVKQYRKGAEREMLEIPAGKLEPGENPKDCAIRELEEEIGASAKDIYGLCEFFPTPAYCSEKISIYFASGLTFTEQHLDTGEFLEIVKIPFHEAIDMVMRGDITDAKTMIALLKANEVLMLSKK